MPQPLLWKLMEAAPANPHMPSRPSRAVGCAPYLPSHGGFGVRGSGRKGVRGQANHTNGYSTQHGPQKGCRIVPSLQGTKNTECFHLVAQIAALLPLPSASSSQWASRQGRARGRHASACSGVQRNANVQETSLACQCC
jgi:hypothetical protein